MNDINLAGNSRTSTDFLGNKWEYNCMGCAIANNEVTLPGGIVYEGNYSILGADPEIPIPGFLVIQTKRHVNSFSELNMKERHEVIDIISLAEKALRELNVSKEVTLVQEERSKHLHVWIFPNYPWMKEKFGKGVTYLRDISEYAQNNVNENDINEILSVIKKIRKYFEEHSIDE